MTKPITDRVKRLREKAGLTVRVMADLLGVGASTYAYHEDARKFKAAYVKLETLRAWEPTLCSRGVDRAELYALGGKIGLEFLQSVESDMPPPSALPSTDLISVPRYDASLSAGPGAINNPHAEPLGHMPFDQQWLRSVTTAAPEHLAVVRISGDSMEPTLNNGDWVLIDRTQRRASLEGFYAFQVGEDTWIKRLTINLRDQLIRVVSDNSAYPMQDLPEEDLHIIGRAVCVVLRKL